MFPLSILISFSIFSSPMPPFTLLANDFHVIHKEWGGYPLPPEENGSTCEEIHTLDLTPTSVSVTAHCSDNSVGNSGRIIYKKTRSISPLELAFMAPKLLLTEMKNPLRLEITDKHVSDDQQVSVSVLNNGITQTLFFEKNNSVFSQEVRDLIAVLDGLFDSTFYR